MELIVSHIYTHMAILLQEIALRYNETDPKKLFWDYFAMYDLWKKVGSGAAMSPSVGRKQEMIDYLYGEVQDRYVNRILTAISKFAKLKEENNDVLRTSIKRLLHARKVKDRGEMHSVISDMSREGLLPDVEVSDIATQQRISTGNPARYIGKVSGIVAQMIQANLQSFVGYDKVAGEKGKEEAMINAPRGEFTPEEKGALVNLGFDIIAQGNSRARSNMVPSPYIHLDKLKDNSYVFFTADKSTIETLPDLKSAVEYLEKNWTSKLRMGRKGQDLTWSFPSTPEKPATSYQPPTPTPAPAPKPPREKLPSLPTNLPPIEPQFGGEESSRIPANWEKILGNYGYVWNEEEKMYKNPQRNTSIRFRPNNTSTVTSGSGKQKEFPNLGSLLRRLEHNRKKRHPAVTGEPAAQVTEEHYKQLYEFLYR
jgi:hypothetical protein